MNSSVLLSLDNIHSGYGPIEALKGVSLEVREGEIVTLIGGNGAGKTTTLLCVSRVHPLRGGKIFYQGNDISNEPPHELVSRGLVHVPEGRKIFARMTVLENFKLGAYARTQDKDLENDIHGMYELFPVLMERSKQLGGTLSGGEQQMLAIARALMSKPKILLMDEPSMGVAPMLVAKIFETIEKLNKEQGLTILLVEQNAHLALKIASRAYVMETGKVVMEGKACELLSDPRVQEAYLGEV